MTIVSTQIEKEQYGKIIIHQDLHGEYQTHSKDYGKKDEYTLKKGHSDQRMSDETTYFS